MKNVMITGHAGFLGSHIAMTHLKLGDTVFGIDNFISSDKNSAHIKELRLHPNFSDLDGDIRSQSLLESISSKIDLIYNFACPASPPIYQAIPIQTLLTCTQGTANVLELAKRTGAVVVHASTSEIYGDPTQTPQHESYRGYVNSYGPRSCYDEGKRAAEALCYDYRNTFDTDVRMVRIFNTYGPNMDPNDGRVVSNFIVQALLGRPLVVFGDGQQTRSFCYVDDLVRGIVSLGSLNHNPDAPINLGNPNEFTIRELAYRINSLFGTGIVNEKLPMDDPMQRCPDITRAKTVLDWEPLIQLDEGLERSIAYFKRAIDKT